MDFIILYQYITNVRLDTNSKLFFLWDQVYGWFYIVLERNYSVFSYLPTPLFIKKENIQKENTENNKKKECEAVEES